MRLTRVFVARYAFLVIATVVAGMGGAEQSKPQQSVLPAPIEAEVVVDAPLANVWAAWTTSTGVPTFMGFEAQVEPRPRGLFRVTFERAAKTPLDRGNDGVVVAVQPMRMLSVSWMTPMHIAVLRGNSTTLAIYFDALEGGQRTLVRIVNTGYGTGPEWAEAYAYNVRGWRNVLAALEYRFRNGPIDWDKALADRRKDGKWPWTREFRDCPTCPPMVVVPAGRFSMGSGTQGGDELKVGDDEQPTRTVVIRNALALSKYEVTVAEFSKFVDATKHAVTPGCLIWKSGVLEKRASASWRDPGFEQAANQPATCISWHDAQAYVSWLRAETGFDYRLPTEAEWEYAARGGSSTNYSFGEDVAQICSVANVADLDAAEAIGELPAAGCREEFRDSAACRGTKIAALSARVDVRGPTYSVPWEVIRCRDGIGDRTAAVGSLKPNGFGLYDTTGNVWEWVEDCYVADYTSADVNGAAVVNSTCKQRVLRGGAWAMNTDGWRSADRDRDDPNVRYAVVGFRVARSLRE
jgi:formylglycine-generating enzyme required for sulfatase activity/uncharacterized protein YndB with AHSA1/START domain